MAWLRIDDGFALHPKLTMLSRAERWTWMELLCYCARYRTDGQIPYSVTEALPKVNRSFLDKCERIGLLDRTDEPALVIHDWRDFNPKDPTAAERKQRERMSRKSHDDVTTETVTETVTDRDSRAGARARSRPVPSPSDNPLLPSTSTKDVGRKDGSRTGKSDTTPLADHVRDELDKAAGQ